MNRLTNHPERQPVGTDVLLCSESPAGAAFEKFDLWIDAQLEALVARWQAAAAPCAHLRRGGILNTVTPQISRS